MSIVSHTSGQGGTRKQPCPDPSNQWKVRASALPKARGLSWCLLFEPKNALNRLLLEEKAKEQQQLRCTRACYPPAGQQQPCSTHITKGAEMHSTETPLHGPCSPDTPALPPTTAFQYQPSIPLNKSMQQGTKTKQILRNFF